MKTLRNIFQALIALIATGAFLLCPQRAAGEVASPDFAFPDKVATDAQTQLQQALTKHNATGIVGAMVNYSLAQNELAQSRLPQAIARIDSVINIEHDVTVQSLLYLLKARIYKGIYDSDSYNYNRRSIPLDSLASDPTAWSGQQFKQQIDLALQKATAPRARLLATPLKEWADIINANEYTYIFYPTLYDLVAYNAIAMYSDLNKDRDILPYRYYSSDLGLKAIPTLARVGEYSRRAHELCLSLIDAHSDRTPALIIARMKNLKVMEPLCYYAAGEQTTAPYLALYNEYKDSEYSIEPLIEYQGDDHACLEVMENAVARYPNYFRIDALKSKIDRLIKPTARYNIKHTATPGKPADINLTLNNTTKAQFYIYYAGKQANSDYSIKISDQMRQSAGQIFEIDLGERLLPFQADTTLNVTLDTPGCYYAWVDIPGQEKETYASFMIQCSEISPILLNDNDTTTPYIVNNLSGAPVQGVNLYNQKNRSSNEKTLIGKTNEEGTLQNPIIGGSGYVTASYNNSTTGFYYFNKASFSKYKSLSADIFTSLPLYHHGDTIKWAAVVYYKGKEVNLADNYRLQATLKDANGQDIDITYVHVGPYGRCEGSFVLPTEGLSGSFSIILRTTTDSYIASRSFQVNDYKLPQFEVAITDIKRSNNPDSMVVVTARAMSYSGFPIANAKVGVKLLAGQYSYNKIEYWSTDTLTDSKGIVTLALNSELLNLSPITNGINTISLDVTSTSGETNSVSHSFSLGKPYTILTQANEVVDMDQPFNLKPSVTDAMGARVEIALKYKLKNLTDSITITPGETLPHDFPPGNYLMWAQPVDTTLANTTYVGFVTLYRTKGTAPVAQGLFVPIKKYQGAAGETVNVLYGVGQQQANILVETRVDDSIKSRRWIKSASGMHNLEVDIPANCHKIYLTMTSLYNGETQNYKISITNTSSSKSIDLAVETFRDKVVPGAKETITLKVTPHNSEAHSAVMMLMESKSILTLAAHGFSLQFPAPSYSTTSITSPNNYSYGSYNNQSGIYNQYPSITTPVLNLYGLSFGKASYRGRLYSRNLMLGASAKSATANEVADFAMATFSDAASDDMAEQIVASEEDTGVAEAAESEEQTQDIQYRPSEIPLAFFAPMLTTDDNGLLTYTYTVPDANTTWLLRAIAYNNSMATSSVQKDIISSRPLMVQPTLPRYLHYGDDIVLRATVMNNTDSATIASTQVELYNATDMTLLHSATFTDTIAAMQSTTVATPYRAPIGGQALLYRIKTTAGNNSDGEQSLLPLLPASQPIITSTPFYIQADSTNFVMTIPAAEKENTTTLYLYGNPLWEIVSALPSLNSDENITGYAAINNLYMASIARRILNRHPALKQALATWLASDRSDTTMESMLSRNDQLKQLALNATPWVRDAMSDNERITSLALMLDNKNIDNAINRSIDKLTELAQADGGLSWCTGYRSSSPWITYRMLTAVAQLKQRGCLPDNAGLTRLIDNALGYIDLSTSQSLQRNKNQGDYTQYALVRSMFKNRHTNTLSSRAINLTVQNILKRWSKESNVEKSLDAIILYHNGYPTMARQLVASIKAYSLSAPQKGTWWDGLGVEPTATLLNTIETVTPGDTKLVESVAQWLIISKTNQSWGNSGATSTVIDALLGVINVDSAVDATSTVVIDDKTIKNSTPQLPGMTVANISDAVNGHEARLTITKNTQLPAMGSIISISTQDFDEIKAQAHPSVSIAKRVNVVRGTTVEGADTLEVGDRVKVQLVIKVTDRLDYITIVDRRAACLEPVNQLSGYLYSDGLWMYREITDSETRMYIESLAPGTYVIDTDMNIMATGTFSTGVATLQSQLNPGVTANSSAQPIAVK